jgi:hypothetical protein
MTELHVIGQGDEEPRGVDADDLARLLDDVRAVFQRFIVLKDEQLDTLPLWVAHTYVFREFDVTPYLALMSPTMRSGKTNLLTVLEKLVHQPLIVVHMSTAALYRSIDQLTPTLLFDELDMQKMSRVYQGILNSGYKAGANVIMSEHGRPKRLSIYNPKAFASIGRALSRTLSDRSIEIHMRRKRRDEDVEEFSIRALTQITEGYGDRLENFRADFIAPDAIPEMPEILNHRERELWLPLFSIAEQAGEGWASTPAALAVRVAGSVRVALGPDGVGASVTRPAPGSAGPVLSTPGPPAGGGPRER